jgi:hypothetical protein
MLTGTPAVGNPYYSTVEGPLVQKRPGTNGPVTPYVDVSLLNPDGQFNALVALLEQEDADQPAPFTGTPPWGEQLLDTSDILDQSILDEHYLPRADVEAQATQDLQQRVRDAYEPFVSVPVHELDDQYGGLGVPPGPPNLDQPVESGHSQIVRNDPSACHGDTAWSGRPAVARVARMFNGFPGYMRGQQRGHGVSPVRTTTPLVNWTQQRRDMLILELRQRAQHGQVIQYIPSVPWTDQVDAVDPTAFAPESPIGPEGVLPW